MNYINCCRAHDDFIIETNNLFDLGLCIVINRLFHFIFIMKSIIVDLLCPILYDCATESPYHWLFYKLAIDGKPIEAPDS